MSAKKSKPNTLFSYFSKTPPAKKTSEHVLSPKKSPNNSDAKTSVKNNPTKSLAVTENDSPKIKSATTFAGTPRPNNKVKKISSKNVKNEPGFEMYDVVWAKLEGYPWWPSLVCNHPTTNKFFKGAKTPELHVQFFDNPTSRAWVKVRNVKPFIGSKDPECLRGGMFYTVNTTIFGPGLELGDKAMAMERPDRSELLVELQPSSEEEDMEFDSEIFDNEMSDEGNDSKENHDESAVTADSKTPRKTPVKRSSRPERSVKSQKKKRRIMPSADSAEESGDEFKPASDVSDDSGSSGVDEADISEPGSNSDPETPVKSKKRKREHKPGNNKQVHKESSDNNNKSSFQPNVSINTKSRLSLFSAPDSVGESGGDTTSFPHVKLDFLQPENIKDIKGRKKSDPEYDARTLHVPDTFIKKQTPAIKQWWELKAHYFDTVLFFKMGKFYELFHMDSVIVVNELGLIYMKGEHAHSGFPEIAYSRYADALTAKGYKVGRIEQTETPDMMAERCKQICGPTKFDKVVRRELCQISTQGTKTYQHLDGDCTSVHNNYLLAIAEKSNNNDECSTYGVCFVDTSIGLFHIGQFTDDRHCSRLRTLLAHQTPSQVLYERCKISQNSMLLINTNLTSIIKESLASGSEFWDSNKTLKFLAEGDYFKENDEFNWPEALRSMLADGDTMGMTAADDYDLAVSALGAMTWYLQYCLLDEELLSMKKFEEYKPLDQMTKSVDASAELDQKHMVLDGITLTNLDVAENSVSADQQGTLLQQLNFCSTPFGKRLFRSWLCAPLCQTAAINDRLDAVEDLMSQQDFVEETIEVLKKLPDLERLLSRIHVLGSANRSKNHPESRAILYEEVTYSKRKIEDFLSTLGAFESSIKIIKNCKKYSDKLKSKILKKSVTIETDGGHFPDIADSLKFFEAAFDHDKARKDGIIIPSKGVDDEYDTAVVDMLSIEDRLNSYLDTQRKALSCRAMVYWGTGKNRYQMEVPEVAVCRVPDNYELMSSKKGWKRYRTTEIEDLMVELADAEDRKDTALKDVMRRLFYSFDERHKKWRGVVECLSVLDVLISMSKYSRCSDGAMCRPEFINADVETPPFIEIRDGRHPCITKTFGGSDFIPNDTVIGIRDDAEDEDSCYANSKVVLVTGPNMGGKSTLMRQVGLITVIAQMGCYVPAEKCRLTPVDRIFTRLGASDRIMAGESTFYVELSETSAILQHATKHSLVLVDELGRGTATYDGTAIACSVVEELSRNKSCRSLFSTHYHSLVEQFSHDQNVRLGHMACMVENECEDPSQETITFLYKFIKGACPKSYGFNAARLADLPEEVIKSAISKAKDFEETVEKGKLLRNLWNECSKDLIEKLQKS